MSASSQDGPIQVFLPDDSPAGEGQAWASLESPQAPQPPAPAPAAPLPWSSVAERLSDSLVGDRPHLNPVYRYVWASAWCGFVQRRKAGWALGGVLWLDLCVSHLAFIRYRCGLSGRRDMLQVLLLRPGLVQLACQL